MKKTIIFILEIVMKFQILE